MKAILRFVYGFFLLVITLSLAGILSEVFLPTNLKPSSQFAAIAALDQRQIDSTRARPVHEEALADAPDYNLQSVQTRPGKVELEASN